MNLQQLTEEVNNIYYYDKDYYNIIQSKQHELLELLGYNTNIKKLTALIIQQKYINILVKQGNKAATINSKLSYLKVCLKYAYGNGLIPYIPTIEHKKIKNIKETYITPEQYKTMLSYCIKHKLPELYKVIKIGKNLGCRISEIIRINPKQDIDYNYIRIYENKTNQPYSIPLNKDMQLFFNKHNKPIALTYHQLEYQFKTMCKVLGYKDITLHTLRHTFGSTLIQKGVSIEVVRKLMNHKSISNTIRYTHLKNKQLEKAMNML